MSAEKNMSNGAPFSICCVRAPDAPKDNFTRLPECLSYPAAISLRAILKSAAAAIVISSGDFLSAERATEEVKQHHPTRNTKKPTRLFMPNVSLGSLFFMRSGHR